MFDFERKKKDLADWSNFNSAIPRVYVSFVVVRIRDFASTRKNNKQIEEIHSNEQNHFCSNVKSLFRFLTRYTVPYTRLLHIWPQRLAPRDHICISHVYGTDIYIAHRTVRVWKFWHLSMYWEHRLEPCIIMLINENGACLNTLQLTVIHVCKCQAWKVRNRPLEGRILELIGRQNSHWQYLLPCHCCWF